MDHTAERKATVKMCKSLIVFVCVIYLYSLFFFSRIQNLPSTVCQHLVDVPLAVGDGWVGGEILAVDKTSVLRGGKGNIKY